MDKKKIIHYIVLLVLLIAASVSLPYVINTASNVVVARILKQAENDAAEENETESEDALEMETEDGFSTDTATVIVTAADEESEESSSAVEGSADAQEIQAVLEASETQDTVRTQETAETQASSESKSSEEDIEQSEWLDQMQAYAESFSPEIVYDETAGTAETDFTGDRERQFLNAVAEYIYSLYDDLVTITRIEIAEETRNDEDVCTCRIVLYADDGNYEEFLCSYNKNYDFYGIYTVDNAETEED
ncbi:MAG: hypothetical protein LIO99_08735 [Clostridiales bacterium]|nr:hypothetical protein [Clostridiales bacterium]